MISPKSFSLNTAILGILVLARFVSLYADQNLIPPPPDDWSQITPTTFDIPKTPYTYQVPKKLSDGWQVGDLRKEKADLGKMGKGIDRIRARIIPDVHSLLVVRHDKLLLEEYFNRQNPEEAQPLYSCTKSVFSTVYGIAQDQGLIDTSQTISDLYPEWRSKTLWNPQLDAIKVGMLLSMTSGLKCNDIGIGNENCGSSMSQSSDWLSFALALPMAHPPGTIWTYNGCCLTLLAHQIAVKSGMNFPQYANKYLLGPLGIGNKEWVTGPQGANRVDYGLYWKARDWAKLGQLYLNKGKWEGKRIVSAAWVKDATTVHAPQGQAFGHDYGYLWHIKSFQWKDRTIRVFFANGYMGQEIFVSPDADLVCIMTASSQSPLIYTLEEDLFENVILASFN